MKKTNACITFCISSNKLEHNKISEMLAIKPNYLRYYDETLNNGRKFGHDEWGIETEVEETYDIQLQFSKIISILETKKEIIKKICKEYCAECCFLVTIVVYNGEFPAMGINTEIMRFAYEINSEIVIDPYYI